MLEINSGNLQTGVISAFPALHKYTGEFSVYLKGLLIQQLMVPSVSASKWHAAHAHFPQMPDIQKHLSIISLGLKLCLR